MALIIGIGFSTPWVELWDIGSRITLLEWLALELSRLGLLSFTVATPVVIVCGALVAALGAWLRIWGSAWLGHGVVINQNMQGAELMADGPVLGRGSWRALSGLSTGCSEAISAGADDAWAEREQAALGTGRSFRDQPDWSVYRDCGFLLEL